MTENKVAEQNNADEIDIDWGLDDDFDPLAVRADEIDQEEMDDDNPHDTVDFPTMRNMPNELNRAAVYTPENLGGAKEALLAMLDKNPGRRPVLVSILGWCENGCLNSELTEKVDALQKNNLSVYGCTTLCRMLERAGGLVLEMPEQVNTPCENVEEGVEYLEIKEKVDPVWRSTEAGMQVHSQMTDGSSFREIVLDRDSKYLEVYRALLHSLAENSMSLAQIEEMVDTFEIVMKPRRFGGHFIDMLERVDAIEWKNRSWCITELGQKMIAEVDSQFEAEKERK